MIIVLTKIFNKYFEVLKNKYINSKIKYIKNKVVFNIEGNIIMNIKKCLKCNAMILELESCNCDNCSYTCCGEQMTTLDANTSDGAREKHLPTYEIKGDKVIITVNHVMEENHYIKWIMTSDNSGIHIYNLDKEAKVEVPFKENMVIYSYCNLHGLWSVEVK